MIVYGSSISPFVRKTLAFAAEKGIEVTNEQAGGGRGSPAFFAASPFGKIPGFSDGDFHISDSTAIITYLDALKPEPNLIPTEPKARARTVWYEEFADTILMAALGKMFFNRIVAPLFMGKEGDLAAADQVAKEELPPVLDYIEQVMPDSGHLVGDRLTLADLAVASPLANLGYMDYVVDPDRYPKLCAFADKILARPSFAPMIAKEAALLKRLASPPEAHVAGAPAR